MRSGTPINLERKRKPSFLPGEGKMETGGEELAKRRNTQQGNRQ